MKKNLLKETESRILLLISKNYTNQQIANEIHLSVHTIKAYNTEIYRKLNATRRTEAVVKAIKLGYLNL